MPSPEKPPVELIQSDIALAEAAATLGDAERVYIDTEFESNRDGTTLCLLQLSRGASIYLVDTLRLQNLEPLARVLGRPECEWVLHAGQQDVGLLMSRLGLSRPTRVFDTQVAWALLGPEYSVSLAYLKYRVLGIRTGKAHQADDWVRRPLPAPQLAYAASDIEHLPALRRELGARAAKLLREPFVLDASRETLWPEPDAPLPMTIDSFRNAWQLDRASQAALRYLIRWYNALDEGQRRNAPEPKTLLAIAGRLPESVSDLSRIKGVSRRFCAELGAGLTNALLAASRAGDGADFEAIDPPPYATFDEIRFDAWLTMARAEICWTLSVAPELVLPGRVLRTLKALILASNGPALPAEHLTGWRKRLLGEAFSEYAARQPFVL